MTDPLTIIDYASIYFRNWFGTKGDAADAYEKTIEKLDFYANDRSRFVLALEGGDLLRKQRFPDYKANRPPMEQLALDTSDAVIQQVESWGTPMIKVKGYEADDVIATLCKQAMFDEVRIITNDKDLYQLIAPNVSLETHKGIVDEAGCVRKFGVLPSQMRDCLALVGDASDNVPGCPNCGPGRARDLLKEFGDVDAVVEAAFDGAALACDMADSPEFFELTEESLAETDAAHAKMKAIRGIGPATIRSLRAWDPSLAVEFVTLVSDLPIDIDEIFPGKEEALA